MLDTTKILGYTGINYWSLARKGEMYSGDLPVLLMEWSGSGLYELCFQDRKYDWPIVSWNINTITSTNHRRISHNAAVVTECHNAVDLINFAKRHLTVFSIIFIDTTGYINKAEFHNIPMDMRHRINDLYCLV